MATEPPAPPAAAAPASAAQPAAETPSGSSADSQAQPTTTDSHAQPNGDSQAQPNAAATSVNGPASKDAKGASPQVVTSVNSKLAKEPLTKQERDLIRRGYKIRIHDGEKQFCKTDTEIGSRLSAKTVCATADQLITTEGERQDQMRRIQIDVGPKSF